MAYWEPNSQFLVHWVIIVGKEQLQIFQPHQTFQPLNIALMDTSAHEVPLHQKEVGHVQRDTIVLQNLWQQYVLLVIIVQELET